MKYLGVAHLIEGSTDCPSCTDILVATFATHSLCAREGQHVSKSLPYCIGLSKDMLNREVLDLVHVCLKTRQIRRGPLPWPQADVALGAVDSNGIYQTLPYIMLF
jgi:hypothetical protein